MIGRYGGIIFQVSDKKIQSFENLIMEISANWKEIQRKGYKPLLEYEGRKLRTIKFEMTLNAQLGVPVRKTLDKLARMAENRSARPLIIGDKRIGKSNWVISKIEEDIQNLLNKGEIVQAKVNIHLMEYIEKRKPTLIKRKKDKQTKKKVRKKRTTNYLTKIAREVMAGKWGDGITRKKKLEASGYNYELVRKTVNRLWKEKKK